jgi:hypothetical protein
MYDGKDMDIVTQSQVRRSSIAFSMMRPACMQMTSAAVFDSPKASSLFVIKAVVK